jgi:hypothetical protein
LFRQTPLDNGRTRQEGTSEITAAPGPTTARASIWMRGMMLAPVLINDHIAGKVATWRDVHAIFNHVAVVYRGAGV